MIDRVFNPLISSMKSVNRAEMGFPVCRWNASSMQRDHQWTDYDGENMAPCQI